MLSYLYSLLANGLGIEPLLLMNILPDIPYLTESITCQVPKSVAAQSKSNRQGRGKESADAERADVIRTIVRESKFAYQNYLMLLNLDDTGSVADPSKFGVAREHGRSVLPVGFYTQWYWKTDLHNLLHFSN